MNRAYYQGLGLALALDAGPKLDKWGNEVEEETDIDRAELKRIRESGERAEFQICGSGSQASGFCKGSGHRSTGWRQCYGSWCQARSCSR